MIETVMPNAEKTFAESCNVSLLADRCVCSSHDQHHATYPKRLGSLGDLIRRPQRSLSTLPVVLLSITLDHLMSAQ